MKLIARLTKLFTPPGPASPTGKAPDPRGMGMIEEVMTEQLPEEEQPKDEES
jgi:hypothetical protein